MSKHDKFMLKILSGNSDANIKFFDLCSLLKQLGFIERIKGSHHIFTNKNVLTRLTLQKDGSKAKAYQVKQVRSILLEYRLGKGEINE